MFDTNIENYKAVTLLNVDVKGLRIKKFHIVTYYDKSEDRYFSISCELGIRVDNKNIKKSIELMIKSIVGHIHYGLSCYRKVYIPKWDQKETFLKIFDSFMKKKLSKNSKLKEETLDNIPVSWKTSKFVEAA